MLMSNWYGNIGYPTALHRNFIENSNLEDIFYQLSKEEHLY